MPLVFERFRVFHKARAANPRDAHSEQVEAREVRGAGVFDS